MPGMTETASFLRELIAMNRRHLAEVDSMEVEDQDKVMLRAYYRGKIDAFTLVVEREEMLASLK